jgi:hypothetical protein
MPANREALATGGARILASACFSCASAFFGITMAFTFIWERGHYFYVYLGQWWLGAAVAFTTLYLVLRPRVKPSIGWKKAIVHLVFVDFFAIPIAVINFLNISHMFTFLIEIGLFLLFYGLIYHWSFRFPPGLRKERDLDNLAKTRAAFLFPLLCWVTPGLMIALELVIFGYWIARNLRKITRRPRNIVVAFFLVTSLALSPCIIETFLVRRSFGANVSYNFPSNVPAGIVQTAENFNITSIFDDDNPYSSWTLGELKDDFIQGATQHNAFTYRYGASDIWNYLFHAYVVTDGINYTYSQDFMEGGHGNITAMNGSVLLDLHATIYINSSMALPANATPHTETFAGDIILVSVLISRDMSCGSLCGLWWEDEWVFIMNSAADVISVLYVEWSFIIS